MIGYDVELINVLDISYYMAFNLVVLTIVMMYSLICPLILPIGAIYYTISYNVDHYNTYYRYPKEYEG